ncbi:MAG: indole-3-glycerol phosphate synthase TrpC [Myxococcales bacterium]|nr:indole-3-glycerol phosphate synthase TrpC [Myxococcales bacterium]
MILDKILASKARELERLKANEPLDVLERKISDAPPTRGFRSQLQNARPFAVIAEVKYRSPSAGVIREDFEPLAIARSYAVGGATAISVLTDAEFFGGSFLYLRAIRERLETPLLCKDFVIDRYQLLLARHFGADAVLLIVAALDDERLRALHGEARELGLDVLVEVHDADELRRAVDLGADLIGVNNRNLKTFQVTTETSLGLIGMIPEGVLVVSESGISDPRTIRHLRQAGFRAFLVGEHLMRAESPGHELEVLLKRGAL